MKKLNKFFAFIISFCFSVGLISGLLPTINLNNTKATNTKQYTATTKDYYYNNLSKKAKLFYLALSEMEESYFKTGNGRYDLVANNIVTKSEIKDFQNGNSQLFRDFAEARDAFMLDNPQIFYVDFDKVTLSFSSRNSEYFAVIDSGRDDNYFANGFTSQTEVETAISNFDSAVETILNNISSLTDNKSIIEAVNQALCNSITYTFDSSSIRSAYGALYVNKAVCEGYAKAFKVIMDKKNIPCVEVIGYTQSDADSLEPHAWNYVQLDNKWYLVDVTFNDNEDAEGYYLLLGKEDAGNHIEDGFISNSGYEISYPNLATFNYGTEEITTIVTYEQSGTPYQYIEYQYKNYTSATAMKELETPLYLIVRHEIFDDDNSYAGWGKAYALYAYEGSSNILPINQNVFSTQFLVTTQVPNQSYIYKALDESKIIARSDVIYNDIFNPTVANSATLLESSPSLSNVHDADKTYEVTLTYNKNLKVTDGKIANIIVYSTKSTNLSVFVDVKNVRVENNKIKFTLTPSKMYEHDNLTYSFMPENITTVDGYSVQPASLVFARPWTVCSKIYNDGRYYINAYGSPTLIDNQDLSMTGFKLNNEQVAENQRSQLVLVAKKPSEDLAQDMREDVEDKLDGNSILSSSTYEIDLHICGGVTQIPSGSYVKVAFGFPEGYSAKDAGVTFKVYHFVKDINGNIDPTQTQEIDCVVTEYGIVVTIDSFSPFMVVATDAPKTSKTIYSKTIAGEGSVSANITNSSSAGLEKSLSSLSSGQTITYTITPKSGYRIDYVLVNKKLKTIENNMLTLTFDELESDNELIVSFVADSVANREQVSNLKSLTSEFIQNEKYETATDSKPNTPSLPNQTPSTTKNSNKTLIIIIIIISVALMGVSTVALIVVKNKIKK